VLPHLAFSSAQWSLRSWAGGTSRILIVRKRTTSMMAPSPKATPMRYVATPIRRSPADAAPHVAQLVMSFGFTPSNDLVAMKLAVMPAPMSMRISIDVSVPGILSVWTSVPRVSWMSPRLGERGQGRGNGKCDRRENPEESNEHESGHRMTEVLQRAGVGSVGCCLDDCQDESHGPAQEGQCEHR
jgi:hypothetical protein